MKSLVSAAGAGRAPSRDAEPGGTQPRVLELFRSWTELKKAHTALRAEHLRLEGRLREQQLATERAEQQLAALEGRLATAQTAYPALAAVQLRALWGAGGRLLRAHSAALQERQLDIEHRAYHAANNRRQFAERQRAEAALREAQLEATRTGPAVARLEAEIQGLGRPWRVMRRREADAKLTAARARHDAATGTLEAAQARFDALLAASDSPFPGLSVAARREINLSLVAFAEALCARLAGTPLLALAAQAAARVELAAAEWPREKCERLMEQVLEATKRLEAAAPGSRDMTRRLAELRQSARYESDQETIPDAQSIPSPAYRAATPAASDAVVPNVLATGTWGIFPILLR